MRSTSRHVVRVAGNRALVRVLASYAIFVVTQYAMWIGILVYAYGQGGVTAAGLVSLAQLIPAALAAPFFATVADRRSPTVLLTGGYVLQALGCVVVAAAIFVDTSPYAVYAGAVLASTAVTTTRPAQAALVPGLARDLPELTATNVLIGWVESISIVLAGTGGGLLMAWNGVAPVAAASVALLAAAVLLVAVLPAVPMREGDSASAFRQVADGIAAARSNKPAGVLVSVLAMEFMFIGALDVLLVVLAIDVLGHGEGWAGYLNSAYGAGGVVVGGFASLIIGRKLGPVVVATGLLLGLAFAATTLVSAEVPVMLLLAVVGASRALFDVASRSLLQRAVSADMVARIFGLTEGLSMAGLAAGSLLVPVLTAVGGGRLALLSVAAILPLVVMLRLRLLLKLDEQAQLPLVEMSLLRSTPVFGGLPAPALEGVARALQRVDVVPGSAIISQGDEATLHYYVVADGVVEIQRDGRPVRELRRGSGLGEIALLHGGPRTASALALTPVTLYSLDRESFLISLQGHAASWSAARVVADEYLAHDSDRSERPPPEPERG